MFSKLKLDTKDQFRAQAGQIRKTLDICSISNDICNYIIAFEPYKKAKTIAGFYPFGSEVDTRQLFQDFSKQWFLPKTIDKSNMVFYRFKPDSRMKKNGFGIYEPENSGELELHRLEIIFIPALMVDKNGHRIGYGKGYYDRFLSKLPAACLKIVPIPEELTVDGLPFDEMDIPVDIAITQTNIYDLKSV